MSQRTRMMTEIWGIRGWKIEEVYFETEQGHRFDHLPGAIVLSNVRVVLRVQRRWAPRCSACGAICRGGPHEQLPARRWQDLPWAGRATVIEASPNRVKCRRCDRHVVELLAWADPFQRETKRLQHHLALEAASMPVMHVAAKYGMSWSAVHRAEAAALARWDATRPAVPLHQVGFDEKWLGRRHRRDFDFVTIVSNLETGEPIWWGPGREKETVAQWFSTLTAEDKAAIELFAVDMHGPFLSAIRADPVLKERPIVHDPFHVMKRVLQAVDETRRDVFFRAGEGPRAIGRGTRWLLLRAWERNSHEEQDHIINLLALNRHLARTYIIKEEMRLVLHAADRDEMETGLQYILRRTQARRHKHLRALHDSLIEHREEILALGEHRPPTGRIEALNNNWETLVRRGRGYRNLDHLMLKLRFMTANPIRSTEGTLRFLALGLHPPIRKAS